MDEKRGVPNVPPPSYQPPPPASYPTTGQVGFANQGYAPNQGYTPNQYPQQYPQQQQQQSAVVVTQPSQFCAVPTYAPDYLGLSIVSFLFCWPLGIVAIMKSLDARRAVDRGDTASALALSRSAKTFSITGLILGIGLVVFLVIFMSVYFSVIDNYYWDWDDDNWT